ncbi:MAG: GTPase Era, partial [Bryobacteraceae bacterium]
MPENETLHRSGFVSILGRPNAGKSTLLNAIAGEKLAIISDKPQTTRVAVQAVITRPDAQIVFADTPGIQDSPSLLNRRLMDSVHASLEDRDLLLFLADCNRAVGDQDARAIRLLGRTGTPSILVLNKTDRLYDKGLLLPKIEEYRVLHEFADYVPVSALTGEGVPHLLDVIAGRLPEGPAYFPEDYLTDQPERFLAAELIREKILHNTRQEVPHSTAVTIDSWEESPRLVRIAATILLERPGQKAIVIGTKGAGLKKIGTLARQEMEARFGRKVFLELFVKV